MNLARDQFESFCHDNVVYFYHITLEMGNNIVTNCLIVLNQVAVTFIHFLFSIRWLQVSPACDTINTLC